VWSTDKPEEWVKRLMGGDVYRGRNLRDARKSFGETRATWRHGNINRRSWNASKRAVALTDTSCSIPHGPDFIESDNPLSITAVHIAFPLGCS
jgi:hypothetical protein